MTIEKARKTAMGIYAVAVIVFLCRALMPVGALAQEILLWLFFGLVAVGFGVGCYFCRCPHCGRGLKVGLSPITRCPVCDGKVTPESKWDDHKGK